ncbi:MAG: hypothetical protein FJ294_11225 [Planctomycetes bacterium]|nr:hypothetical protein [Planctomycetota bacterium]
MDALNAAPRPRNILHQRCATGWLAAGLLLAGCGRPGHGEASFSEPITYKPAGQTFALRKNDSERFGVSASDFARAAGGSDGAKSAKGGGKIHWETPAGWVEVAPTGTREANFKVAGDPKTECYLTRLAGIAGGLESNINRWRAQISLPPLSAAEIAQLPRLEWLDAEAVLVNFEGQWKGMSGTEAEEGWRLVGLLSVRPDESLFLKMVGPTQVVSANLEPFVMLAASLHDGSGHSHDAEESADQSADASLPPDHPPITPADTPVPAVANTDSQRGSMFQWKAPAGWTRGADKSMREVTYLVDGAECYVTLLGGTGGGLLGNIQRWCGQFGAEPLAESELGQLQRIEMLDGEGVIVKILRGESAAGAPEALLGALCVRDDRSLFVKFVGPDGVLEAQRAAFLGFCRSLAPLQ